MKKICTVFLLIVCSILLMLSSCDRECRHDNLSEETTKATCVEKGKTVYTCLDCGYSYTDKIIEPVGHAFEKNSVEPTCTKDGYTEYTCECGFSYVSDYVSANGHTYTDTLRPSDCTNGGYTEHKCSACSYSYISNQLDPDGHELSANTVAPTCTDEGYTVYSCTDCDYSFKASYTAPAEHDFLNEVVLPTCLELGYTQYTCKNCDYAFKSDFKDPAGHTYIAETISKSDCVTSGEEKYKCACGDTYSVITPPNGHEFTRSVTMPTLSDMGYTENVCSVCEYSYVGNYTFYSDILQNAYAENSEVFAKGIDISHHNYKMDATGYISLDWDAIKASGVTYVIIRIGDAAIGIDPTFEKSYADAKAAGLDVGFYFYTRAQSVNEIRFEANLVASALEGKQFEYPVYLDLEDEEQMGIHASVLNEMCVEFFSVLQGAGYYTGLYVNHEWLNNVIDTDSALSRFEIWYARYPDTADGEPPIWNVEENGKHLGMWQYSDAGVIDGIDDTIFDFNYCYKDYPSIIKEYGFNGYDGDVKFQDDGKSFVWVTFDGDIVVRSKKDYFITDDYDASLDIIGYASKGTRFEVIEKTDEYTVVEYNGDIAYITANPKYVSYQGIYIV